MMVEDLDVVSVRIDEAKAKSPGFCRTLQLLSGVPEIDRPPSTELGMPTTSGGHGLSLSAPAIQGRNEHPVPAPWRGDVSTV